MVVGVLEVDLEEVVVDVLDGGLDLDAVDAESSNCISAIVPVVSWVSVWSTRSAISLPGVELAANEVVVEDLSGERGHWKQYS